MKVLVISSKPPYPTIDGGCYASARLLENLAKTNLEVKYLTISTKKHPFELEFFPKKIVEGMDPEQIQVNTNISIPKAFVQLFKSGSYNVIRFHNELVANRIDQLLGENFDYVLLDGLYTTSYITGIRKYPHVKILLRTHNIEADIWDAYAKNEKNPLKRGYLYRLAKDLRAYENEVFQKVDKILPISLDDESKINAIAPITPTEVLPVAITVYHQTTDYSNQGFFHIGSMNWQPNIEAVEELIRLVSLMNSGIVKVKLAGSGMNEWKREVPTFVEKVGFVEDPALFAVNSGILVSPIRSGSGVRIKILEMLAAGVPVITTPKGAEGLYEKDMLLIGTSDQEIVAQMEVLSSNEDLRKRLGSSGIAYIEKYHNPKKIIAQLSALFNEE